MNLLDFLVDNCDVKFVKFGTKNANFNIFVLFGKVCVFLKTFSDIQKLVYFEILREKIENSRNFSQFAF